MSKFIKKVNNRSFELVKNPYYKKNNFECKYKIMYFSNYYNCHVVLFRINNKKDFRKKNIKKYFDLVID